MAEATSALSGILRFFTGWMNKEPLRSPKEQEALDVRTKDLALYQSYSCPFCVKVRRFFNKNDLNIHVRDARNNAVYRRELKEKGGKTTVPCLKIKHADGRIEWMYESDDIIQYIADNYLEKSLH